MLSIVIPVFNHDVTELVSELHFQSESVKIPYEILLIDDCSEIKFREANYKTTSFNNVRYIQLNKNIGRASIRNLLMDKAVFDTLLFLDCDSSIISSDFIKIYLPYIDKNQVVCGGRVYQPDLPEQAHVLHWKYGKKRESRNALERQKFPTRSFMTNNFMISKRILKDFPFQETHQGYGHEDTFLGIQLFKSKIPVIHEDNPVLHADLQNTSSFLMKAEEAISNLILLYQSTNSTEILIKHVSLLKAYNIVRKLKSDRILIGFFKLSRALLIKNLKSGHPSLHILDLYKLGFFSWQLHKMKA